ncbi:hypothetical protein [Methylobacterium marchantiae]|uniref:Uncharacterized protein n=1 Tax=Methylobacterium marchantiae TaxID=600331 RepID=A0ABW3WY40_9HYPH|nr:hypothetical protein AIGOOFII_1656 [Methylobacterium marchantiae]
MKWPAPCAIFALLLSACGTTPPRFDLSDKGWTDEAPFVQAVTSHIHCEMRNAVLDTYDNLTNNHNDAEWMKTWSAKISLTLNVNEMTALNPSVTVAMPSTLALGLAGSLSSEASRELEIDWFAVFSEYFNERQFQNVPCDTGRELYPIAGTLGLKETLFSAAFPASLNNNISNPFKSGGRLQVIQQTTYFYIKADGNINPAWKFTEVSANQGGKFFDVSRNRKDTLLVTMGPTQLKAAGRPLRIPAQPEPIGAVTESHFAKQIGNAVANGINNLR